MSKKNAGKSRQKEEPRQPTPSTKRSSARTNRPSSQTKPPPRRQRKLKRNEIRLEGNTDYGDSYNTDGFDTDAENYLKKTPRESALHYSAPPPPAKAPISPYRRRLKRFLFGALTLIIIVTVGLLLSFTVFFKIEAIEVAGDTRYPSDQIISASMIQEGENFFLCNTSPGERNIWEKFPYIESVHIEKKLFNKIVINVQEAVPSSVVESEGKYVLLSESGKIIDIADHQQADVPIVMGAQLAVPTLSASVKYQDENVEGYLNEILEAAAEYKLGVLSVIDITKLSNITLETKDGFHIILGKPESIRHKMMTAKKIMKKDVPAGDVGTLDVSFSADEGGKSYFSSKKPEPAQSQTSQVPQTSRQTSEQTSSQTSQQTSRQTSESSAGQTSKPVEESSTEQSSETTSEPSEETPESSVDSGYTDYDTPDDGGYTDYDTPDDGGYTDYDTPDDGGYTDYDNPDDGGYTDYDNPDDGGYTDYDTPDDGGYTDYDNPDDGGYTDYDTPDDGGYTDYDTPDDGGYTDYDTPDDDALTGTE